MSLLRVLGIGCGESFWLAARSGDADQTAGLKERKIGNSWLQDDVVVFPPARTEGSGSFAQRNCGSTGHWNFFYFVRRCGEENPLPVRRKCRAYALGSGYRLPFQLIHHSYTALRISQGAFG